MRPIAAGTRIIEYTGELISHAEGERRYPTAPDGHEDAEHTYLLQLDDDRVIDANVGGNDARFINHSCAPNCEPMPAGDHMWIVSVRGIRVGEELGYDYAIELDEPHTPARKQRFPCRCGARDVPRIAAQAEARAADSARARRAPALGAVMTRGGRLS